MTDVVVHLAHLMHQQSHADNAKPFTYADRLEYLTQVVQEIKKNNPNKRIILDGTTEGNYFENACAGIIDMAKLKPNEVKIILNMEPKNFKLNNYEVEVNPTYGVCNFLNFCAWAFKL